MPKKKSGKDEMEKVLDRISRVEGQLKGIRRMINDKSKCTDIIAQVLAIREAIGSLGIKLLKSDFICKKKAEIDDNYLKTLFKIK